MLIDAFMPVYDIQKRHETSVKAATPEVFAGVRALDMSESPLIRYLCQLRGLPKEALTLRGLQDIGFTRLGYREDEEILLGITGRFWTIRGDIVRLKPEEFGMFDAPGYAQAVWNFSIAPAEEGASRLRTETRVRCIGQASYRKFRVYWFFVAPFSFFIRRQCLQLVKRNVTTAP